MIKPVNAHIMIEPVAHDSFVPTTKGSFEEVGLVLEVSDGGWPIKKGDKVWFDGWKASRYPKNDKEWFWLVAYEDIRAIDDGT